MSAATTLTASIKNENRKANTAQSAILLVTKRGSRFQSYNVTYIIIGKYVKQKNRTNTTMKMQATLPDALKSPLPATLQKTPFGLNFSA